MNLQSSFIPKYSYQDYQQWKEDWELIDGYPFSLMPSAKLQHGRIQIKAIVQAENAIALNKANCNCTVF